MCPRPFRAGLVLVGTLVGATVLLPGTGCVRVWQSQIQRRELLRTTPLSTTVTGSPRLEVSSSHVASVVGGEQVCTRYRHEYQQVDRQSIETINTGKVISAGAFTLAGLGAWGLSTTRPDGADKLLLQIFGPVFALTGVITLLATVISRDDSTREVALADPEREEKTECVDRALQVRKPLRWEVTLPPERLSGSTSSAGRIDLRPVMFDLLAAHVSDEPLLRRTLAGTAVPFEITVGDAPRARSSLDAANIPDSVWDLWGRGYAHRLDGSRLLRWDSCVDVAPSARQRLSCLWDLKSFPGRLLTFEGQLPPAVDGYAGALAEFSGEAGQTFDYRILLPKPGADWLLRVVEVESGEVIEEDFTARSLRYQLSGALPRKGTYALVHTAPGEGGPYTSTLALGGLAAHAPAPQSLAFGRRILGDTSPADFRDAGGRYVDHYTLPLAPGRAYRVELRSADCSPELQVRGAGVLAPAISVVAANVAGQIPAPDSSGRATRLLSFVLPAAPNGGDSFEITTPPGESKRCAYELLVERGP